MTAVRRARKEDEVEPAADVEELQKALAEANAKLESADSRRSRAVSRGTSRLRKENEMLEAQLTRLVQEIGQVRHSVDRVQVLERDLRTKDLRIAELEAEIERLEGALSSGRPTALAAAAASQAARLFGGKRVS